MQKITVHLEKDKKVEVVELPLMKYSELMDTLEKLPKKIQGLNIGSVESMVETIPTLIKHCLPELIDIISIATNISKEEVQIMGLSKVAKLIEAIFEVNDFEYLFNLAKKALARYQESKSSKSLVEKTTGSGGQ